MTDSISYQAIGRIHTPFKTRENSPVQSSGAKGTVSTIEIKPEFSAGLKDLEGFSHIVLIYHFHLVDHWSLSVTPFLDVVEHGIFATRSPIRPNPIGMSVLKIIGIKENLITVEAADMLDQTPILDIKPFIPSIDEAQNVRLGWLTGITQNFESTRSDDRFNQNN